MGVVIHQHKWLKSKMKTETEGELTFWRCHLTGVRVGVVYGCHRVSLQLSHPPGEEENQDDNDKHQGSSNTDDRHHQGTHLSRVLRHIRSIWRHFRLLLVSRDLISLRMSHD